MKKTNKQIELIVFKKVQDGFKFLMLLRNPAKGGFWQPITGGVEEGEDFAEAAVRELREESGVNRYIRLFDTGYSFEFSDNGLELFERVFAVEVAADTAITLSAEHTDMRWASEKECIEKYLKYPGNITGLKTLSGLLTKEYGR